MKCPSCGSRLLSISRGSGEWICDNPDCPDNKEHPTQVYAEFYGHTQKEVNAMKKTRKE